MTCSRVQPLNSPSRSGRACAFHHARASGAPDTVRARTYRAKGELARSLSRVGFPLHHFPNPNRSDNSRENRRPRNAPLKMWPARMSGPMYPIQTSKKRPCCLCSRSAGARSIQGPCRRLVTRNAGAVPTRSTSKVAIEFGLRRRLASAARALEYVHARRPHQPAASSLACVRAHRGFTRISGRGARAGSPVTAPESLRPLNRAGRGSCWSR